MTSNGALCAGNPPSASRITEGDRSNAHRHVIDTVVAVACLAVMLAAPTLSPATVGILTLWVLACNDHRRSSQLNSSACRRELRSPAIELQMGELIR
jgi:hypothetical protein